MHVFNIIQCGKTTINQDQELQGCNTVLTNIVNGTVLIIVKFLEMKVIAIISFINILSIIKFENCLYFICA